MNKFFNGRKYCFEPMGNRWFSTTKPYTSLSHDTWNFYHSDNPILKDEVIHHPNGDSSDDRIENLQKMTRGEHGKIHANNMSGETKQKISKAMVGKQNHLGKHHSVETKKKMVNVKIGKYCGKNSPMFGKHHTGETKQKLREGQLGDKNSNWKGSKIK